MDSACKLKIMQNQKGTLLVYIALAILAFIGLLGLAIDLGHLYLVRGELQNAADASALAGAKALYTPGSTPPALDIAWTAATDFIPKNRSEGTALSTGTVVTGYWDTVSKTIISTPTPSPAVGVTISKSPGKNGGEVPIFFAKVLPGISSLASVSSARAIAIRGFAGSVPPNAPVMPIALSGCMTNAYFSQIPLPIPATTIKFGTGSSPSYEYAPGCISGQWTSLTTDSSSASYVKSLVDNYQNGFGSVLNTNDTIYIKPGVTDSIYSAVPVGVDVVMPIVGGPSNQVTDQASWKIAGFAWFHVDSVVATGNPKYVSGHFIDITYAPVGSLPGGSASNALASPQLVQ